MIEVKRNGLTLTIKGHAQSAEKGKDLICASASMLFYTLVANIEQMEGVGKCKSQIKALEGDAEVKVIASPSAHDEVTSVFNTIMTGYEVLSNEYPEFIKILI